MSAVALYVDPRGPYPGRVECFDGSPGRDARAYEGPGPIVAHPPCGPWSKLRHQYQKGGHDCGPRAVEQVRKLGGVLEHPKDSKLWDACDLPKPYPKQGDAMPFTFRDAYGGFSIAVAQSDWGHVARKATWLYIVGVDPAAVQVLLDRRPFPGRAPTHWASGSRGKSKGKTGNPVPPGIKVCSASQRIKTPPAFADFLLELAGCAR